MNKKCLDDELYDIYLQVEKPLTDCLREIYNKGKEDAETEHKAMCDSCVHKVSKEDIDAVYNQAIDDAIEYFTENANEVYDHISARDFICDRLEQLKKQTDSSSSKIEQVADADKMIIENGRKE